MKNTATLSSFSFPLRIQCKSERSFVPRGKRHGHKRGVYRSRQGGSLFVIAQEHYEALQRAIFNRSAHPVFAVLDGAIVDGLPALLKQHAPDAVCLFSGNLDPMLAAAAPYLLPMSADSGASTLTLRDGWNEHWGIVLSVDEGTDLYTLRSHLRRIFRVTAPGGESLFFRFYDPRAFRSVVPTLEGDQLKAFFGPIRGCYIEGRSPDSALYFSRDGDVKAPRHIPFATVA